MADTEPGTPAGDAPTTTEPPIAADPPLPDPAADEPSIIRGTERSDIFTAILLGTGAADEIYGLEGNDWLDGGAGPDTLNGGAGFDAARYDLDFRGVIVDLFAGEAIDGTGSTDILRSIEWAAGSIHADRLIGSNQSNDLLGLDGNDTLFGGGGADDFWGGPGADRIDGGAGGRDRLWYDDSPAPVLVNLAKGWAEDGTGSRDTVLNVEDVVGSSLGDRLIGGDGANRLSGGAGNDTLRGQDGRDWLDGGRGNDLLDGGAGNDVFIISDGSDTLLGGAGRDQVRIDTTGARFGDRFEVDLGAGTFLRSVGLTTETHRLDSVERVAVSGHGASRLTGSGAADTLIGGAGPDTLFARGGRDRLDGGKGDDLLSGGGGADRFVFRGEFGRDTITDFSARTPGETITFAGRGEARSFAEFRDASQQVGRDVIYDLGDDGRNVLILRDVDLTDLARDDIS